MKDRIMQIMKREGMSQQEFSRATGLTPASLSSIFTGRTSPTIKHAEALHKHFPKLNMSWLLFGDGDMFVETDVDVDKGRQLGLFDETGDQPQTQQSASIYSGLQCVETPAQMIPSPNQSASPSVSNCSHIHSSVVTGMQNLPYQAIKNIDIKPRKISEIRIFFDDGTFEVFSPNE